MCAEVLVSRLLCNTVDDRSIRTTYCLQRLAWDSEMEPAMLIPRSTT